MTHGASQLSNAGELSKLMNPEAYERFCAESEH